MSNAVAFEQDLDKVLVPLEELDKIDHYTGHDGGLRFGPKRTRKMATPDFKADIQNVDGDTTRHEAYIVEVRAPETGSVAPDEPVAIARVFVGDESEHWYLLISSGSSADRALVVSDILISYEGDPVELFEKTHLFDVE